MTPLLPLVERALAESRERVDRYERRRKLLKDAATRLRLGVSEAEVLATLGAHRIWLWTDGGRALLIEGE